jgi:hypothetical protein
VNPSFPVFLKMGRRELPLPATDDALRHKAQRFADLPAVPKKSIRPTTEQGSEIFWREEMYLTPLLKASAAMFRSGYRMTD